MARIRTIKPELWTDPEFTECSMSARVLFIALLNFASDYGVLPDKPRQLKMQCLPADSIDVEPLIDELIERHFLIRRTAPNGDKVLVIRTFTEHQKINRPTLGRWGDPAKWDEPPPDPQGEDEADSLSPHGDLSESSPPEGKGTGREGKGSLSSSEHNSHLALVPPVDDDDDFEATVALIVDARCAGRTFDRSERGYRATVRKEALDLDGDLIRRMLADGSRPDSVASFVLRNGFATEAEKAKPSVPWCGSDCPTCDGTSWVVAEDQSGMLPCPDRRLA